MTSDTDNKVVVLMVEDDGLQAATMEQLLTDAGFAVLSAYSGADAIRMLKQPERGIQGVITDIRLGEGPEGWDVAVQAREIDPGMPVLYVSGDKASDWASKGVPNSIMVPKPYADAQITTAISELLNSRFPPA
jgi:two-component system cell cycle response regulator CpdR